MKKVPQDPRKARKPVRKIPFALLALATALAISPFASADSLCFSISGSGIAGSGIITFSPTSTPGIDEVTGITGTFSTTNNGGFSGVITGLGPGSYDFNNPTTSSNDLSVFDNLFFPAGTAPSVNSSPAGGLLDEWGLLFDVSGGYTVNLWGNGTGNPYSVSDGIDSYVDNTAPVDFTVSPEPSSLLLLGSGLLGLAMILFRKSGATVRP
jgi:hypothetical protein